MRRRVRAAIGLGLALSLGCSAPKRPQQDPAPPQPAPVSSPGPVASPIVPAAPGTPDPRLPVVGDPLGLLARAPAPEPARTKPAFDPGALMASAALEPPTRVEIGRDPRAVARGRPALVAAAAPSLPSSVQARRASELLDGVRAAGARPHVLYLYASYCKACRNVLPSFLELVRSYRERGVRFTAASVDHHAQQVSDYAPALAGVLPALWIKPEGPGVTLKELRRAGLKLPEDSYSIPLFGVFDRAHRLVSQGGSRELYRLPETLDSLL